jgi:hypothetical protein
MMPHQKLRLADLDPILAELAGEGQIKMTGKRITLL